MRQFGPNALPFEPVESPNLPRRMLTDNGLIKLELWTPADAEEAFILGEANRKFWTFHNMPPLGETLEQTYEALHELWDEQVLQGKMAPYKIMFDGLFVGDASFHSRPAAQAKSARIGYRIGEPWQRKGIISTAVRRLARFGLEEWGLREIYLDVRERNARSQGVARSLGAIRDPSIKHKEEKVTPILGQKETWRIAA